MSGMEEDEPKNMAQCMKVGIERSGTATGNEKLMGTEMQPECMKVIGK